MTYIKNQQGIKRHYLNRSDHIAYCFKISFLNESIWENLIKKQYESSWPKLQD